MSGYGALSTVYDLFNGDVDYGPIADFLALECGEHKGLLLDLGCGTGSLSIAMSQRGFDVVGVDASEVMLMQASGKAVEVGQDVLFINQAFDELDLYGSFDCCISTFDTLNHLTDRQDFQPLLHSLRNFLNPGALFFFDVNSLYKQRSILGNNTFYDYQYDHSLIWQCELQPDDSVAFELTIFSPAGTGLYRRTIDRFTEIYLPDDFIRDALRQEGYELVKGPLDGFTDRPAHETSERLLYIAART